MTHRAPAWFHLVRFALAGLLIAPGALLAQEASAGFDFRATVSGGAAYSHQLSAEPRSGSPIDGGFRAVLYPTLKLSEHWDISGAVQIHSAPYFFEQFSESGHAVTASVLQAHLKYSRIARNRSLVVRLGQLTSAFGAFGLRYDDAANPLIDLPMAYGYYYKPVSLSGLLGAQVDATVGKLDMRAQFVNSSPANPRAIYDRDQYGNWAGGAGYTIKQGFRVGASAYRGPYLDRTYAFFFPGEAKPRDLPGSAYGIDAQWALGHWNVQGELQRFQFAYKIIPTYSQHTGYIEARRVLHPRFYLATRLGYLRANFGPGRQAYEFVTGFRPNRHQLLKLGYQIQQGPAIRGTLGTTIAIQLVTSASILSIARD